MGLLPDLDENGRLIQKETKDDLRAIFDILPKSKKLKVDYLMANEGFSLRKALENVGVLICER